MKDVFKLKYVCAMDKVYCALIDKFWFGVRDNDFLQKYFSPLYQKQMREIAEKYGSINDAKILLIEKNKSKYELVKWKRAHKGLLRFEIIDFWSIAYELQEFICEYNIKLESYKENGKTWWVASQHDFDGLRCNFGCNVIGGYRI